MAQKCFFWGFDKKIIYSYILFLFEYESANDFITWTLLKLEYFKFAMILIFAYA